MTVLFLVDSAYQTITAIQLRVTKFKTDDADIIITDKIANKEVLCDKIKSSGVFRNAYTMKTKGFNWKNWKYTVGGCVFDSTITGRLTEALSNRYDIFLYGDDGEVAVCVGAYLRRKQECKLMMFEDGFASYSDNCRFEIDRCFHPYNFVDKTVYLPVKRTPYYTSKYYMFNPELASDWNFGFPIEKIERLGDKARRVLNKVFDYNGCEDDYSGVKYIFFEESYYADGIEVNDIEVVNRIAEIVGKENMMIKIHPRNPENRFAKLGYRTNKDTVIPWEVIALNNDFSDTILITIASGSSITSYFNSGKTAKKSLLLYDMEGMDKSKLTISLAVFDKICRNDSYFVYPKDYDELERELII